jgi:GTP-binding protein EngB required for normal cell division
LERGDRKIQKIKKRIIALVGLTRAGKSCTYNWILDRSMVGKGNNIQANYIPTIPDEQMAVIGDGFTSVTLIPNSTDYDGDTSIIDLPGYFDARNFVGVMGVSYFLKSTFDRV